MPAPLSIVIPAFNAGSEIEACLSALAPGVTANLIREVLVVDGGSSDRTLLYAHEAGARVISGSKGRGRQLQTGAANAQGDWLLFLHADSFLEKSWADAVRAHIRDHSSQAGYFSLAYRSDARQARWLESRGNLRANWLALPYGDQGLLIKRELYDEVGGYEALPLMEDVSIVRRLGKARLRNLGCRAFTSADKYERDGWRKRAYSNAFLLTRYLLGASPEKLAKQYR